MKWHQRYRIEWDATDGRNGGAQRTVWENVMEMERLKYRAGEEELGAVALVLDLAKVFERVSLEVVWAWATQLQPASQGRSCGCHAGTWSTRGGCRSKDVRRSRSGPSRPSCQGHSGVACFYASCCRMYWVKQQKFTTAEIVC